MPFDFEDTILGYPVQDIAMALLDLMLDVKPEEYIQYKQAFQTGYTDQQPWPEVYTGQIDTFQAGRILRGANWLAINKPKLLKKILDRDARILKKFLDTRKICLQAF